MRRGAASVALFAILIASGTDTDAECRLGESETFTRWAGVAPAPERGSAVFVYAARGDEPSLEGVCLARCRELPACSGVAITYAQAHCTGFGIARNLQLVPENDAAYFEKICLQLDGACRKRWWAAETTAGYRLHAEGRHLKVVLNATVHECYAALYAVGAHHYRSAQWVAQESDSDQQALSSSRSAVGSCILNAEDKYTEPESYRVANYNTLYIENQCRHDYPEKIDRCSYEEYYNQTLKHIQLFKTNTTKDECRAACEDEEHFVCRGFTWRARNVGRSIAGDCGLHADDLLAIGSWFLKKSNGTNYYRRVICLNISVECTQDELIVSYRPRGSFNGRVYVPGRGERCTARADANGLVRLALPLYGDCDVNFAHAITKGPQGFVNRTMAYVMLMIQNNPIIQTAGDRWVRVGCSPSQRSASHVDATVTVHDDRKPSKPSESSSAPRPNAANAAASAVFNSSSSPTLTMYVVRVDPAGELEAASSSNAVSLGEALELRIETQEEAEFEAYHLVASSRLGDSSVLLLDSRGCPTGQVDFPGFSRSRHGSTQRLWTRFKAFRFPSSHVVRFALMVRFCDGRCPQSNCGKGRSTREANETSAATEEGVEAVVRRLGGAAGVVAQGGLAMCGREADRVPLELELVVGAGDRLTADTLLRADHRNSLLEDERRSGGDSLVCVHELLLVALALTWLAVQVLILVGCCVLVKRYRHLAELSMQKDYQSFDNIGFDTVSTHRRVHWPDQNVDILHVN